MPAVGHDGSLASLTEAWIAAQLVGTSKFAMVEVWPGAITHTVKELVDQLKANPSPYGCVFFSGDIPIELEEGAQAYEPTYEIYVMVRNERPGKGRTGDDTETTTALGTNGFRDVLRSTLHDKAPNQGAGGFYTDRTMWKGCNVVIEEKPVFIMHATVVVRESPTA